ncbi:hypothetical protein SSP24_60370 [Streptomyces spinoverrucosus]|uniref:Uncharacterized protein n=1 Tax=Streptomyces spinoverrucosus TaxID=284043 RepID=A0A4Y3VMY6_9ACTN|nr:hypothetical protein SSP24_60370 [Streptomyces spinoverrucosus]GHB95012.1 hypothetical protein GCM10010397_79770 [Streptomyces spinoverrucosus]
MLLVQRGHERVGLPVASDPTVSRLVDALASAGPKAPDVIRTASAEVRDRVWKLADTPAPDVGPGNAGSNAASDHLPLHEGAQNQIWLEIVQIVLELPAWTDVITDALARLTALPKPG